MINHTSVCPACGYCPHCGRRNATPYNPWPQPYNPWRPYWSPTYTEPHWGIQGSTIVEDTTWPTIIGKPISSTTNFPAETIKINY